MKGTSTSINPFLNFQRQAHRPDVTEKTRQFQVLVPETRSISPAVSNNASRRKPTAPFLHVMAQLNLSSLLATDSDNSCAAEQILSNTTTRSTPSIHRSFSIVLIRADVGPDNVAIFIGAASAWLCF